ncbi:hypothetical protein HYPSUDRAFT_959508 [Hypholoma sublateritium FD-334 SS-4]|uniref:Uncharacterized protein n=1 Tax=Hypholoma sublateritium (strain FD-334 SS-4) TaxID=945553 RepID=A0A0D2M5G2_HYPSF|nr:hypothetical protein HYPSUDRAFT_959508 [Hypholoma sublateritium FD-334 SS-4]
MKNSYVLRPQTILARRPPPSAPPADFVCADQHRRTIPVGIATTIVPSLFASRCTRRIRESRIQYGAHFPASSPALPPKPREGRIHVDNRHNTTAPARAITSNRCATVPQRAWLRSHPGALTRTDSKTAPPHQDAMRTMRVVAVAHNQCVWGSSHDVVFHAANCAGGTPNALTNEVLSTSGWASRRLLTPGVCLGGM